MGCKKCNNKKTSLKKYQICFIMSVYCAIFTVVNSVVAGSVEYMLQRTNGSNQLSVDPKLNIL